MSGECESYARLSLNQLTTQNWSLPEAVEGCVRAGLPYIGVWRDKLQRVGLMEAAQLIRDAGLTVSSLCRGGFFTVQGRDEWRQLLADNRQAIDEAAALEAAVLVLVCGGPIDGDLETARERVVEGIGALVPYARARGVRLGIEPLHPMQVHRSVVNTLGQANDIAEQFDENVVGVIVDTYHVWWDPQLYAELERAAGRIIGFHISDWLAPPPDVLMGRGLPGDGIIDLASICRAVEAAGYRGPVEVEVFNHDVWEAPGDEVIEAIKERYTSIL